MQELVAGLVGLQEDAREGRCRGDGVGFLDAAHGHAGVHRLDDDRDAERLQGILDAVADLLRQALLDLQAAGIGLDHARDLGQAGDPPVRDIGHMCLADERKHVMLAQREQFDVLDQDHLAVRLREDGGLYDFLTILEISLRQELHGFRHALRRLGETFPLDVLAEELENGLDVAREFLRRFFVVFFQLSVCHGIVFAASSDGFGTAKLVKKNYYIPIFSLSLHP